MLGLALLGFGCGFGRLEVRPDLVAVDRSTRANVSTQFTAASVMILEPTGAAVSDFEPARLDLERGFMLKGIRLVVPAVTGRIVQEQTKTETAALLSDLERAIVLARSSGADVILQVGAFASAGSSSRFFCLEEGSTLTECDAKRAFSRFSRTVQAEVWRFLGRLLDTASGEVLASIDIAVPIAGGFEGTYDEISLSSASSVWECGKCASDSWCNKCSDASKLAREKVVEMVVSAVAQTHLRSPGSSTPPRAP